MQVFEQREGSLRNKDEVVDDERSALRATCCTADRCSSHDTDGHPWQFAAEDNERRDFRGLNLGLMDGWMEYLEPRYLQKVNAAAAGQRSRGSRPAGSGRQAYDPLLPL